MSVATTKSLRHPFSETDLLLLDMSYAESQSPITGPQLHTEPQARQSSLLCLQGLHPTLAECTERRRDYRENLERWSDETSSCFDLITDGSFYTAEEDIFYDPWIEVETQIGRKADDATVHDQTLNGIEMSRESLEDIRMPSDVFRLGALHMDVKLDRIAHTQHVIGTPAKQAPYVAVGQRPSTETRHLVHEQNARDQTQLDDRKTQRSSRKGLPLLFELGDNKEIIMTRHDTGTEANHMSLELATKFGYDIDTNDASQGQFQLPNGKIIKSIGKVTAQVQFAQGQKATVPSITCYFNVFQYLVLPVLMGMTFLDATETLTRYTSRLATLPTDWKRSLRLCAVGSAPNRVTCLLDGYIVWATADTGAEIALVSGKYAMDHGLLKEYSCEEPELADGSKVYTSGHGDVAFSLCNKRDDTFGTNNSRNRKTVRFHVLDDLNVDVLLDEGIVEDFGIFRYSLSSIVSVAAGVVPGLGTIFHLGSVEGTILSTKDTLKERFSSFLSSKADTSSKCICNLS
jgi:hypothetical protein